VESGDKADIGPCSAPDAALLLRTLPRAGSCREAIVADWTSEPERPGIVGRGVPDARERRRTVVATGESRSRDGRTLAISSVPSRRRRAIAPRSDECSWRSSAPRASFRTRDLSGDILGSLPVSAERCRTADRQQNRVITSATRLDRRGVPDQAVRRSRNGSGAGDGETGRSDRREPAAGARSAAADAEAGRASGLKFNPSMGHGVDERSSRSVRRR